MAIFWPFLGGVLRGSLPRAYLNLLFFERGPKLGLKKGVKNGGLRGSNLGHFWPQMLENVPNAQCGRNFFKKWYFWPIFLQNEHLVFSLALFQKWKNGLFYVFSCFFAVFYQKWPFLTLFEPSKMDENPFGTYFAKNDKKRHFCKNSFFENVFHKIDSLNFRVAKKC